MVTTVSILLTLGFGDLPYLLLKCANFAWDIDVFVVTPCHRCFSTQKNPQKCHHAQANSIPFVDSAY